MVAIFWSIAAGVPNPWAAKQEVSGGLVSAAAPQH